MKIDTLNNYGGTIQDIHDNTIYVAPNQTIIAAKKETVEAEEVNDEVIISNNDTEFVRQLFTGYKFREIEVKRSINRDGNKRKGKELVIYY